MEEKVYNLLEKMYIEMTSLKDGQQELVSQVAKIQDGQQELRSKFDKLELRIESEVINKIRGLYDFREVQTDVNSKILSTLDKIDAKIDVLQMETSNIRRVK